MVRPVATIITCLVLAGCDVGVGDHARSGAGPKTGQTKDQKAAQQPPREAFLAGWKNGCRQGIEFAQQYEEISAAPAEKLCVRQGAKTPTARDQDLPPPGSDGLYDASVPYRAAGRVRACRWMMLRLLDREFATPRLEKCLRGRLESAPLA